jgi:hypothetical protein
MSDRLKVMITLHKTRVGAKLPCHHVKLSVEGRTTICSVHFTNYTKEGVIQDYRTVRPSNWRLQRRPYPSAVRPSFHYLRYRTSQESIAPTMRSDKKNDELKEVDFEVLGFDQGGQYHKNRVWCSTAEDIFFLTNPAVIASEDAKRIAKVALPI